MIILSLGVAKDLLRKKYKKKMTKSVILFVYCEVCALTINLFQFITAELWSIILRRIITYYRSQNFQYLVDWGKSFYKT